MIRNPCRRQATRHSLTTVRTVSRYAPAQSRGRRMTAERDSGSSNRASFGPASVDLCRIHDMENQDLVTPMPQEAECLEGEPPVQQ